MDFTQNALRLSLFSGHYGSGKTNLAINFALSLKKKYERVAIADLDIVNPYYRTKDAQKELTKAGIRLICSDYAESNVDVPSMPAEAYALCDDKELYGVIDVGGDDRGALALGRYSDKIKEENNYDMFFVVNMYRPLTRKAKDAAEVMREIEKASGIDFTGIINNSNLGIETKEEDISASLSFAKELSEMTGLKIRFTGVKDTLYEKMREKVKNAVPVKLYVTQSWLK